MLIHFLHAILLCIQIITYSTWFWCKLLDISNRSRYRKSRHVRWTWISWVVREVIGRVVELRTSTKVKVIERVGKYSTEIMFRLLGVCQANATRCKRKITELTPSYSLKHFCTTASITFLSQHRTFDRWSDTLAQSMSLVFSGWKMSFSCHP